MDPNQPPAASSLSMRQTSLSDLLAGVRSGEAFSFGLARGSLAVPLGSAAQTHTSLESNDPLANIPPLRPRSEYARQHSTSPFAVASGARATAAAAAASREVSEEKTPHPPRRSQRLATSSSRSQDAETHTSKESRKRKARSAASPAPRKRASRKKPPPNAKDDVDDRKPAAVEQNQEEGLGKDAVSCCICMCEPEKQDVSSVNGCEHLFCFDCIGTWADRENSCPLCKCRFTTITRVHKVKRRKGEKQVPNSKKVKPRDQRADVISGPAIEAMLASIAAASAGNHSRFGRFLVALGSHRAPSARRTTLILEDDIFSDETDDDELPMINFNNLMNRTVHGHHRGGVPPAGMFDLGFGPMPGPFASAAAAPPPSRNHASNMFERSAGTPDNPLEILSEDDDDDFVEVVEAARSSA